MFVKDIADAPVDALNPAAAPPAAPSAAEDKKKGGPKRKIALHLAYLGIGYYGMQRNPGFPTIEADLESALVKAGAISEQNAGSFVKIHWSRAARTDKGVSAACQVVSAKLMLEPKGTLVERINAQLPQQIHVLGFQRTTEGFDARKFCDKRKYEYILPAWVFDPEVCTKGRGQDSSGDTAAAASTAATSASGTTAGFGAVQHSEAAAPAAQPSTADDGPADNAEQPEPAGDDEPAELVAEADAEAAAEAAAGDPQDDTGGEVDDNAAVKVSNKSEAASATAAAAIDVRQDQTASSSRLDPQKLQRLRADIAASRSRFVFSTEHLQRLNQVLKQFEGTHNYHNFTLRLSAMDPQARRYIISFKAELMDIKGQPWVKLVVLGQSFMLHQIRKMVGMAIAAVRGIAPAACLRLALDPDRDLTTPMAPALGLFLDETYFDAYNTRFGELHGPLTFEPFRAAAEDFKRKVLYQHIASSDERELINALWLRGCTDAYFKFTRWHRWRPARSTAALLAESKQAAEAQKAPKGSYSKQLRQQQSKRHADASEQRLAKQQRLERPGRLQGATPAMVVGMQETYGMQPHKDTPKAAQARQELQCMRQEHQQVLDEQQQQQQQQQQEQQQQLQPKPMVMQEVKALAVTAADVAELDSLYDLA